MKKNIIFIFCLMVSFMVFGQVGINTKMPQKSLHVNGSIQIVNELNVGGNSVTAGNPGTNGQILTSQGANTSPLWNNIKNNTGVEMALLALHDETPYSGPKVLFKNIPVVNENLVQNNDNGNSFKILKSGYYGVNIYTDAIYDNCTGTCWAKFFVNDVMKLQSVEYFGTCTKNGYQVTTGIIRLEQGDVIRIEKYVNNSYRLAEASFSLTHIKQ